MPRAWEGRALYLLCTGVGCDAAQLLAQLLQLLQRHLGSGWGDGKIRAAAGGCICCEFCPLFSILLQIVECLYIDKQRKGFVNAGQYNLKQETRGHTLAVLNLTTDLSVPVFHVLVTYIKRSTTLNSALITQWKLELVICWFLHILLNFNSSWLEIIALLQLFNIQF